MPITMLAETRSAGTPAEGDQPDALTDHERVDAVDAEFARLVGDIVPTPETEERHKVTMVKAWSKGDSQDTHSTG